MARLVAIEWDTQELRLASGTKYGSSVLVDTLLSTPLHLETPSNPEAVDASVGQALSKLITQAGLSRSEVVIAAGRANVELRALSLPPASDDELPEMVRFAAQRTFAQIGDTWPLDFIRIPSTAESGLQVLASAMNPALVSKLKKVAEQANLDPKKILLRPLATASLTMAGQASLKSTASIVVSVVGDEADLLVTQDGVVALVRTSRLPSGEASVRERAIVAEIKRTWMAAESQVPPVKPTQLVVWGDLGAGPDLSQSLAEKTGLPTTILKLASVATLKCKVPDADLERFVPAVGMIHQSYHLDPNCIDFISPRKRTEKKKPVLQMALAGTILGTLAVVGIYRHYSAHWEMDRQIAGLKKESKDQEKLVKASEIKSGNWKKVASFLQSDTVWLDQLSYLSEQSLPADSMIVNGSPSFSINTQTGAALMNTSIAATEQEMLTELEENLRDNEHTVVGNKAMMNKDTKSSYPFVGTILIETPAKSLDKVQELLKKPARPIPEKAPETSEPPAQPETPAETATGNGVETAVKPNAENGKPESGAAPTQETESKETPESKETKGGAA